MNILIGKTLLGEKDHVLNERASDPMDPRALCGVSLIKVVTISYSTQVSLLLELEDVCRICRRMLLRRG